jgi:uncharacterized Zn-binding protein involved in type VI secretion
MSNAARIGDIAVGVCCCHSDPPCVPWTGVIVSGAGSVIVEGSPLARIGDLVVGCHAQVIVSGSGTVMAEGSPVARLGDATAGCTSGTIVTGAGTVLVGG